jgi:hypothetical protein
MTLAPLNDNLPRDPAGLQAAFASRYAPTPREQVLLLTRARVACAPATGQASHTLRLLPRLTRARAYA